MARVKNNILVDGLSGKVGKLVFKQYRNKTVVTVSPDMSNVEPSASQLAANGKFKLAVAYAQKVIQDPVIVATLKRSIQSRHPIMRQSKSSISCRLIKGNF